MSYSKYHSAWSDYPATTTPVDAAALDHIEQGIADGRAATAIDIVDSGGYYTSSQVEGALQEVGADIVTLQGQGHPYVDATDFGALADDSTDNTSAFGSAINAVSASGGLIVVPPGTYRGSFSITGNKPIHLMGYGAKIRPLSGNAAFSVSSGNGDTAVGHTITGFLIDGSLGATATTGVKIVNTDRVRIHNIRVDDAGVGVHMAPSTSAQWVEGTRIDSVWLDQCVKGIYFDAGSATAGSPSFGETVIIDSGCRGCTAGVEITAGAVAYRTFVTGLTIWMGEGQAGVIVNGDMYASVWQMGLECTSATTASTAIDIQASSVNTETWTLFVEFTGTMGTKLKRSSTAKIISLKTGWDTYMYGDSGRGFRHWNSLGDSYPVVETAGQFTGGGGIILGGGTGAGEVQLYRNGSGILESGVQFYAVGGVTTKTTSGAPSDTDTVMDQDGTIILDTTNHRLYVRSGGVWKYAALV